MSNDMVQLASPTQGYKSLAHFTIKLGSQVLIDDVQCLGHRHPLAVRTRAGHGVKCIAYANNSGIHSDFLAGETSGIASPIGGFVVRTNGFFGQFCQWMAGQHAPPYSGVRFDDGIFLIRESIFFAKNVVRNADFSQVMQEGAHRNA